MRNASEVSTRQRQSMVLNGVADEVKRIAGIPRSARFFSNAESAVDAGDHPAEDRRNRSTKCGMGDRIHKNNFPVIVKIKTNANFDPNASFCVKKCIMERKMHKLSQFSASA